MKRVKAALLTFLVVSSCCVLRTQAVEEGVSKNDLEEMKKQILQLSQGLESAQKELKETKGELNTTKSQIQMMKQSSTPIGSSVSRNIYMNMKADGADAVEASKYDGQGVTTGIGRLKIGGLVQVWANYVENDNTGVLNNDNGFIDVNEGQDNDSWEVRRAELNFTLDIHKNISAYMMMDFAGGFARQGQPYGSGYFKTGLNAGGQRGSGVTTQLQDALINFHDWIPHHDITVGQFLPTFSMEDFNPNWMLDFVERSWVGNHYPRDVGINIHGSWWDNGGGGVYQGGGDKGRFQYWLSMFNGKNDYHTGFSQGGSDDNDAFDFLGTAMVRPVWGDGVWGNLELAYSLGYGWHGEQPPGTNGLGARETNAIRHSGWAQYAPNGPVKGIWFKGEYAYVHDRQFPGVTTFPAVQTDPQPFNAESWQVSAGYRLGKSVFADHLPRWAHGLEPSFRYQEFDHIYLSDLVNPNETDVFASSMATYGVNYYIREHNAKIQLNYNVLREPDGGAHNLNSVHNNSLQLGFQVMW